MRASDEEILLKSTGAQSEQYERRRWDASAYIGEELLLEIVDTSADELGHLNLDDINIPTAGDPDPS